MKIEEIDVKSLKPYENNPRINDASVDAVANSIKAFGFRVPVVVDKDNVIIAGHTRLKAALKLGLKSIPCIRADDLTPEQVKAFRIADNSAGEASQWDWDKLNIELEEISLDMGDFGLKIDLPEIEPEWSEPFDRQKRVFSATHFDAHDETRTEGRFDMPKLQPVDYIPTRMIGFNYINSADDKNACIHFFLDDYLFERVWNRPEEYLPKLTEFEGATTPNYSIYLDMPEAVKIWNTYRARLLGQMMQDRGIRVLPIVYWSDARSYEYCFDGLPECSTLIVNNIGNGDPEAKELWDAGMNELIKRKKPKRIIIYGNGVKEDYNFGKTPVVYFRNEVIERMKNCVKRDK